MSDGTLKAYSLSPDAIPAFMARVEPTDGHWLWVGHVNKGGYGRFSVKLHRFTASRQVMAHTAALVFVGVGVPFGHVADHLCRVRNCVNPTHLDVVTSAENARRACRNRGVPVGDHEWSPIARDISALEIHLLSK